MGEIITYPHNGGIEEIEVDDRPCLCNPDEGSTILNCGGGSSLNIKPNCSCNICQDGDNSIRLNG